MKNILTVLLIALSFTPNAFADEKVLDGYIISHPASVLEITDIKVVEEHIAEDIVGSYLVLEVTGNYESYTEKETVMLKGTRTDDGIPMSFMNYDLELYSVVKADGPIPLGANIHAALSHPQAFKTTLKLEVNLWGKAKEAEYRAFFRYQSYMPVRHTVSRGFNARLWQRRSGELTWSFNKSGF